MAKPGEPNIQPNTIEFGGNVYTLSVPFRWVDEAVGICEGPLYSLPNNPDWLYLPDAGYLHAHQALSSMHRIQAR